MDTAGGRRAGTLDDFCNLIKLCQNFEVIHVLGGATEPQDVPVHIRHLEVTRAQLMLCDKIPFIFSRGHKQVADNFELIRLAHGISPEEFVRGRTRTPSSIRTRRCSSTFRWPTASSISRPRARCSSSRPLRWRAQWRR